MHSFLASAATDAPIAAGYGQWNWGGFVCKGCPMSMTAADPSSAGGVATGRVGEVKVAPVGYEGGHSCRLVFESSAADAAEFVGRARWCLHSFEVRPIAAGHHDIWFLRGQVTDVLVPLSATVLAPGIAAWLTCLWCGRPSWRGDFSAWLCWRVEVEQVEMGYTYRVGNVGRGHWSAARPVPVASRGMTGVTWGATTGSAEPKHRRDFFTGAEVRGRKSCVLLDRVAPYFAHSGTFVAFDLVRPAVADLGRLLVTGRCQESDGGAGDECRLHLVARSVT